MRYFFFLVGLFFCLNLSGQVTYWVNTTDDIDDGVCDGVHCSLREAANASNSDGVISNIYFNIPGDSSHTISILDDIRLLGNGDNLDGTTQPGNNPMKGLIIIDGSTSWSNANRDVLIIGGDNISVKGLQLKFLYETLIWVNGDNCKISNNILHTAEYGINLAGLNNDIFSNYFYNLSIAVDIRGNSLYVENNKIFNNKIGLDIYGNEIGRVSYGVLLRNPSSFNRIINRNNQISNNTIHNTYYGIYINGTGRTEIYGNRISKNSINNADYAIYMDGSGGTETYGNSISENKIYCSENEGITLLGNANQGKNPPNIIGKNQNLIIGTSEPFDTIEIFKSENENCTFAPPQGETFLGKTYADINGDWRIDGIFFEESDILVATATDAQNNTSTFSATPEEFRGSVYWINSSDAVNDGSCDDIHCSFSEAISEVNFNNEPRYIYFNIPEEGPFNIPTNGNICLRQVCGHDTLVIDGTTQPNRTGPEYIRFYRSQESNNHFIGVYDTLSKLEIYGIAISGFNTGINLQDAKDVTIGKIGKECLFQNNEFPILNINSPSAVFHHNQFECFDYFPFLGGNNSGSIIYSISDERIYVGGGINDTIFIYEANESCIENCGAKKFIGQAIGDSSGRLSFPTPDYIKNGSRISVLEKTNNGYSSSFSCKTVTPSYCKFAENLRINDSPCSGSGPVLDLKQLDFYNGFTSTSNCSNNYGNRRIAWYKVIVPSTGNFLVRTNISNTVIPVIEVYTDCGNTALPECMVLDSLPYVMVFENYSPNDTLYLRVGDKNNTIVNSENTALLHITAHKLAANKDDWEICDYDNLISDNPTNLTRREANSFILSYEEGTPQSEIDQNNAVFTGMMEMELKKECACGDAPLQLWSTETPIVLDNRRRYARTKAAVDTTNYNYIFETVEFQVNNYAIGQQYETDIGMDTEGNFAMVWKDKQRRHNYGRVYLNSGNPLSVEFQIGTSEKTQFSSDITMFEDGEFTVVWSEIDESNTEDTVSISGRTYYRNGLSKGAIFPVSFPSSQTSQSEDIKEIAKNGINPSVASNTSNFIVTWQNIGRLFAQKFDRENNLVDSIIEIGTNINGAVDFKPSITMNDAGNFIIAWSGIDENENGIYAQQFNTNGAAIADAFLVNTTQNKNQSNPDIVLAEDGSFIITWESFGQVNSASNYDIYAQRFNTNANKVGNEFLVNSYTTDAQTKPSISLFDNGNFLIAWSSFGQDGFAEGIYAKLFDANGNPIAPSFDDSDKGSLEEEFRMNTYNEPQQDKPRTATNGENIFMGTWEDGANDGSYEGIFAQRFETIEVDNTRIFYPIGTATPSTLMGDEMPYPTTTYNPGSSVKKAKVAILDTGIDHTHELIQRAIWYNPEANDNDNCLIGDEIGYDFVNRTGTPLDLDGHGTQVNGILTRDFDSEIKLELMNLKFHELEKGSVFDAICGIYYAVDNGANIINLSWGFEASEEPAILKKALQYASDKDVLVVTTAGNTSKNNDRINKYPANLDIPNMIVVTAYQYKNSTGEIKLANYASHGHNTVDIAAYGYVETAKRGGQKALAAGTSLAAPAVARTAATIKGLYPVLTAAEIKDCILSTAETVGNLENKVATGGILDHDAALACAQTKAAMVINTACATSNLTLSSKVTGACNAESGAIQLSYTGNVTNPSFLWSTGDTTQHISNLAVGTYSITVTDTARCEQPLSITIPNDCDNVPCKSDLILNALSINSTTYQSSNTIIANGTIEVDSNIIFKAAEFITLTTGFHAKAGSQFLAQIEACNNNIADVIPSSPLKIAPPSTNNSNKLSAKIYPNPTQNILNIEVKKPNLGFELALYDLMGRQLDTWQIAKNQATISVSHLNAGIYFLRIDSEVIEKFVVGRK